MPHATWADDAHSIDYRHLGVPLDPGPFLLSGEVLARLAALNRFDVEEGQDAVLFGLRGCGIVEGDGSFGDEARLVEAIPDHGNFQCVLGVWKRSTNQVAVFPGSTVPSKKYMPNQVGTHSPECNMLLSGRYLYFVGNHRVGESGEIRGVFKQPDGVVVLRSIDNLTYETSDLFDPCDPGDNIHPARPPEGEFHFSSEGCQTVQGNYAGPNHHTGPWSVFRNRAGLGSHDADMQGIHFVYFLLTGREARLVSTATLDQLSALKRLRYGSADQGTDTAVTQLQNDLRSGGFLHVTPDGHMGQKTVMALIARQKAQNGNTADGIFIG